MALNEPENPIETARKKREQEEKRKAFQRRFGLNLGGAYFEYVYIQKNVENRKRLVTAIINAERSEIAELLLDMLDDIADLEHQANKRSWF